MAPVRDLVLAAPAVLVVLWLDSVVSHRSVAWSLLSLPVALAVIVVTVWALTRWASSTLTLTHLHVIFEYGILVRVRRAVPLAQVHRVVIRRTLLGLLLGYGSLEFYVLASETPERFRFAPAYLLDQGLFAP
jgi:membrane protein YdbS with pleckstrin-like domain